jgi:CDP-diacylglycerol--glycerol-3-phosphate 3-phosphatidyltransferase
MTEATFLTLLRLVLTAPIALSVNNTWGTVLSLSLFSFAAATDYCDGVWARLRNQVTGLGAWLDASVDKVFVYTICIVLWHRGVYVLPVWLFALGRDVAVEVLRQFSAAQRHIIPANSWGKRKFILQCASIFSAILSVGSGNPVPLVLLANGLLIVATLASLPGVWVVWRNARRR